MYTFTTFNVVSLISFFRKKKEHHRSGKLKTNLRKLLLQTEKNFYKMIYQLKDPKCNEEDDERLDGRLTVVTFMKLEILKGTHILFPA